MIVTVQRLQAQTELIMTEMGKLNQQLQQLQSVMTDMYHKLTNPP